MITPSFSLAATERVLPKLALNFTTASLDSRVTFTRALNTATRTNASGFIEGVNANIARFDYDPVTLVCKGLLIEELKINYLLGSQTFNNGWVAGTIQTVTLNAAVSPDGTLDASLVTTPGGSGPTQEAVAGSASGNTASVYAKKYTGATNFNQFAIRNTTTATTLLRVSVNYDTGAIAYITGSSGASVQMLPNGWIRIILTVTAGISNTNVIRFYVGSLGSSPANDAAYFYGAQLEAGAFATSYIPTTVAVATRNADVAVMTGANFSDWYSAGVGGLAVSAVPLAVSGVCPAVQFDDTTANEIIALRGNTTNPELYIVDGGTPQVQLDAGTIAANTAYNIGSAWATNNCAAAVNGGAAVTDTSATMPTVTQARLGSDGTNYLNGRIQSIRYWPQRITDAEVQSFSK